MNLDHLDVLVTDEGDVTLTRRDLPAVASRAAFEVNLTETALVELLSMSRARQLGIDSTRDGGL